MRRHYNVKHSLFNLQKYLYVNVILDDIDAFGPFWHVFRNSFMVRLKTELLHSNPFTKSQTALWTYTAACAGNTEVSVLRVKRANSTVDLELKSSNKVYLHLQ